MVFGRHSECMGTLIIIAVVLLTGPAAILFGADSRRDDDRGSLTHR
jgi:hypothetical protein